MLPVLDLETAITSSERAGFGFSIYDLIIDEPLAWWQVGNLLAEMWPALMRVLDDINEPVSGCAPFELMRHEPLADPGACFLVAHEVADLATPNLWHSHYFRTSSRLGSTSGEAYSDLDLTGHVRLMLSGFSCSRSGAHRRWHPGTRSHLADCSPE